MTQGIEEEEEEEADGWTGDQRFDQGALQYLSFVYSR